MLLVPLIFPSQFPLGWVSASCKSRIAWSAPPRVVRAEEPQHTLKNAVGTAHLALTGGTAWRDLCCWQWQFVCIRGWLLGNQDDDGRDWRFHLVDFFSSTYSACSTPPRFSTVDQHDWQVRLRPSSIHGSSPHPCPSCDSRYLEPVRNRWRIVVVVLRAPLKQNLLRSGVSLWRLPPIYLLIRFSAPLSFHKYDPEGVSKADGYCVLNARSCHTEANSGAQVVFRYLMSVSRKWQRPVIKQWKNF